MDKNYVSFAKRKDISVTESNMPLANNVAEYGKECVVSLPRATALIYDDILKFSLCSGVNIEDMDIYGGKEDCIDIVRGSNYFLKNLILRPSKKGCGITIKGGVHGVILENITFANEGGAYEIDLGNWTHYDYKSRRKVSAITIKNVKMADGGKVRIRVLHSAKPVFLGDFSNIEVVRYHPFVVASFFWLKRVMTFFGLSFKPEKQDLAMNYEYELLF